MDVLGSVKITLYSRSFKGRNGLPVQSADTPSCSARTVPGEADHLAGHQGLLAGHQSLALGNVDGLSEVKSIA